MVAKMSATSPACAPADSARTDASIEKPAKLPRVSREYEGLDIFKVGLHDPHHDEQIVTLVLRRDGLFIGNSHLITWYARPRRVKQMHGAARLHEQIA